MFRFHTGSIKSPIDTPRPIRFWQFRFHTGSIKRRTRKLGTTQIFYKFRFHTGSIKSVVSVNNSISVISLFRFHTGSIKSFGYWDGGPRTFCFDSTLVRLKDDNRDVSRLERTRFRFHTGSIKSCYRIRIWFWFGMFRFHTGSIKSRYTPKTKTAALKFRFHTGSIKRSKDHRQSYVAGAFRFHTGSIKSNCPEDVMLDSPCFDSTLVRLKGYRLDHSPNVNRRVSIPHWFD